MRLTWNKVIIRYQLINEAVQGTPAERGLVLMGKAEKTARP